MAEMDRSAAESPVAPAPRTRLWRWFVVGFLLVLLGIACLPMEFYDGRAVYQTFVWRYYLFEIQLARNSSGFLGPTTGNAAGAVTFALGHVLCSLAGGAILMGIGWLVRRPARKS